MNNVKNSIGWADWTINPVKGLCPINCKDNFGKPYCYARKAYGRNCNATFRDKTIRYDGSVWKKLSKAKSGDKIFVGSTIDLFHPECSKWNDQIFLECVNNPDLIFIFATKMPQNLPKELPKNCWVLVSVDGTLANTPLSLKGLAECNATVKGISFEPLLGSVHVPFKQVGATWAILGQKTKVSAKTRPNPIHIQDIIDDADKDGVAVFVKDNILKDKELHWVKGNWNRHEFPVVK